MKTAHKLTLIALCAAPAAWAAPPIPYLEFNQTRSLIQQHVPCKWITTVPAKIEDTTYEFLCKGGAWGTVTLLLDQRGQNNLNQVKLIWRNWDPDVHPAGGEAQTAAQFLQFVLHNIVPQKIADRVNTAFFKVRPQTFLTQLVKVDYTPTFANGYTLHTLTITGRGPQDVPTPQLPQTTIEEIEWQAQPTKLKKPGPFTGWHKRKVQDQRVNRTPLPAPQPQTPAPVVTAPAERPAPVTTPTAVQPTLTQTPAATIRWQGDTLEINGLSTGRRLSNTGVFDAKEGQVFQVLRSPDDQLRVTPPPVGAQDYRDALDLTNEFTRKVEEMGADINQELEELILTPDQVAPLLQTPQEPVTIPPIQEQEFENLEQSL